MAEDIPSYRHHETMEKQLGALEAALSTTISEFEKEMNVRITELWMLRFGDHPVIRVEAEERK